MGENIKNLVFQTFWTEHAKSFSKAFRKPQKHSDWINETQVQVCCDNFSDCCCVIPFVLKVLPLPLRLPVHHRPNQGDPDNTRWWERCPGTHRGGDVRQHEDGQLLHGGGRRTEVPHHAHHTASWGGCGLQCHMTNNIQITEVRHAWANMVHN